MIQIIHAFMIDLMFIIGITMTFLTIVICYRIHAEYKAKSGGYVAEYFVRIDDPEVRQKMMDHIAEMRAAWKLEDQERREKKQNAKTKG